MPPPKPSREEPEESAEGQEYAEEGDFNQQQSGQYQYQQQQQTDYYDNQTGNHGEFVQENGAQGEEGMASRLQPDFAAIAAKSKAFIKESKKDVLKRFNTLKQMAIEQKRAMRKTSSTSAPQRRKLTKADIGGPRTSQFIHEAHIGWNPESGFDIRNIPEEWVRVFDQAGITKEELEDRDTAAFIMKNINRFSRVIPAPPPPPPPPAPGAPPPPPAPSISGSSSSNLLASLQSSGGVSSLKKADEREVKHIDAKEEPLDMASLLAAAMSNRRAGVQESDDDDGWGSDEENDWND